MNVRISTPDALTKIPTEVLAELASIVGADNVITEDKARTEAGHDWWPISIVWRHDGDQPAMPAVVVRPNSAEEVAAILATASEHCIPVTPFAGRSGVCGGSLPIHGGISLDMAGLDQIHEVDTDNLMVHVDAGVLGPDLEQVLAKHGMTVGHFPQSFDLASVGGWIACRGIGQFSNRYGKIEDMVLGLEVALADGTIMQTNPQPAAATGPDLMRLFLGAEGTLGVVTSAWLQLWPAPEARVMQAYSFDAFTDGIEALRRIMRTGARPACLRLYDGPESARHFALPDSRNAFVVLAEGNRRQTDYEIEEVESVLATFGGSVVREDVALVHHWLETRNDVSALDTVIGLGLVVDTIEIAAPWSKLPGIYTTTQAAVLKIDKTLACTAHASHSYLSGGCLYFTFAGAPGEDAKAKDAYYVSAWDAAMRAVRDGGGTISHHHGIGLVRARFMEEELGSGLDVLRALKAALDPQCVLNPDKLGLGHTVWP